ncbi:MAG: helix-turn-helix transcriptional regulator [Xenococcus sp. MO_188.B8]|nr:helix-turn-helix transcriptional regulator [Xenococcus sp. MO_188.B8]
MHSKDVSETAFNKALRMVMAEFNIQGVDLASQSGLSKNAISRARKDTSIKSDTIIKISEALAKINIEAYKRFWTISSGCESLFENSRLVLNEKSKIYKV